MKHSPLEQIKSAFLASSEVKQHMAADAAFLALVDKAATRLIRTVKEGGTIYTCGNGGSACDSIHFTEELVARYKAERPGIRAMHLMDPGTITCWSNDYEFDTVFERYVQTFCGPKDTLVAISTSGNSQNILNALQAARALGTFTIGLGGKSGGCMKEACDLALIVPAEETERIQEAHITLIHVFCQLIEEAVTKPG